VNKLKNLMKISLAGLPGHGKIKLQFKIGREHEKNRMS
jgi:hypothetical protein